MTTLKYKRLSLGIDIGSTTAKLVVCNGSAIICKAYERHYSLVQAKTAQLLEYARETIGDAPFDFAITGSAGLGIAKLLGAQFVQEVFATAEVVKKSEPDAACVIELGGEDAKMIFFDGGIDERMNGTCAGGTGAFIDQMATLLNLSVDELDELSLRHERIYPIASRCGVFAKTDIQALLNQGAAKEDVAASIYQAVVNQTIAGLAQGRRISGKVLFLGGPMYYCKGCATASRKRLISPASRPCFLNTDASRRRSARRWSPANAARPPIFRSFCAYLATPARNRVRRTGSNRCFLQKTALLRSGRGTRAQP
jgi:predicted CoA-substrate-specific enzyme activase